VIFTGAMNFGRSGVVLEGVGDNQEIKEY